MPLLYPVGFICTFWSYWADKVLFLREFRKPPYYDDGMAIRARKILKFSIVVHCLMSLYIYSNDTIINYSDSNVIFDFIENRVDGLLETFLDTKIRQLDRQFKINFQALNQYMSIYKSHSIVYMTGLLFILIIVLLEEIFGTLTGFGLCFSFCCLRKIKEQQE